MRRALLLPIFFLAACVGTDIVPDTTSGGTRGPEGDDGGDALPVVSDTDIVTEGTLMGVAYADGHFVAVGHYPSAAVPDDGWIVASEDGRVWSEILRRPASRLTSVAYGAGRWVAVGWDIWPTGNDYERAQTVLVSDDGVEWTETSAPSRDVVETVVWTGWEFLVGPYGLWASEDGVSWEARSSGPWPLLVVGDSIFGGGNGAVSVTIDGGRSWTSSPLPEYASVFGLWKEGETMAGSAVKMRSLGYPVIHRYYDLRSDDALSWEMTEGPEDAYYPVQVVHGDGASVAILYFNALGFRDGSQDEWTYSGRGAAGLAWGAGVFVAVFKSTVAWSLDGETWTEVEL